MKPLRCLAVLLLALIACVPLLAEAEAQPGKDDGFVPMFNGKDLTGWVNVNGAPSTFYVKDNQIITTGRPTGYLRTAKQYENFIAEFDWMHVPPKADAVGNSGFFVWADPIPAVGTGYSRGIEVQVLVNLEWKDKISGKSTATSHGDLFSIWGAKCVPDRPHPLGWERCIPSENRAKGANEWNHYRVEANDGVIKLAVNGKVVSGVSKCSPRKGYLALESEGSECRFKNLKIKELPSTNPKADEIADVAQGHRPLYTGLDLSGWIPEMTSAQHWHPKDTVLHYVGKGKKLATTKQYGNAEFIVDFRFPAKGAKSCSFAFRSTAKGGLKITCRPDSGYEITGQWVDGKSWGLATAVAGASDIKPAGQWNRLKVALKDKKKGSNPGLTLTMNGKTNTFASLPGMLPNKTGSFALQADGPMDFANMFVRELGKQKE